jgi:hypothetical protein
MRVNGRDARGLEPGARMYFCTKFMKGGRVQRAESFLEAAAPGAFCK